MAILARVLGAVLLCGCTAITDSDSTTLAAGEALFGDSGCCGQDAALQDPTGIVAPLGDGDGAIVPLGDGDGDGDGDGSVTGDGDGDLPIVGCEALALCCESADCEMIVALGDEASCNMVAPKLCPYCVGTPVDLVGQPPEPATAAVGGNLAAVVGQGNLSGTCGGDTSTEQVWFVTAPRAGPMLVTLRPNTFVGVLYVRAIDCEQELACAAGHGVAVPVEIKMQATAGRTYAVVVDAGSAILGGYMLDFRFE